MGDRLSKNIVTFPGTSQSNPKTLKLPPKLERPVRWLLATLDGECGPEHPEFKVPLRHLVIKGGRGSAKSHSVARILLNIGRQRPYRFLCARETMKSIDESVKQLLEDCIDEYEWRGFYDCQKTTIKGANGSQFIFAGLRNQDMNKLKSTERLMIAWCEEAHVLSERSIEVLTPTIRAEGSVCIYTYNPELDDDPVHANFALEPEEDVCVIDLNWRDNPWFPKVLEGERKRTFNKDKSKGKTKYNWIWEGKTLPAVEGAIFATEVSDFQQEGRFRLVDYDALGKVYVVMDLGYGVTTWALCQRFASTLQCFDYYEFYNSKYSDMSAIVRRDHEHVRWGDVFMPHDATHKDPKTAKSHRKVMRELGWSVKDTPQIGVENYIEQGRELFAVGYIDSKEHETGEETVDYQRGGKRLLQCLKRFRRQIPTTTEHPGAPLKDEFSHGAETWCYTAVVAEKMVNDDAKASDPYKHMGTWAG